MMEVVKLKIRGKRNHLCFSSLSNKFVVVALTKVVDMLIQPWAYRRHQSRDKTASSRLVVSYANTRKGEGQKCPWAQKVSSMMISGGL